MEPKSPKSNSQARYNESIIHNLYSDSSRPHSPRQHSQRQRSKSKDNSIRNSAKSDRKEQKEEVKSRNKSDRQQSNCQDQPSQKQMKRTKHKKVYSHNEDQMVEQGDQKSVQQAPSILVHPPSARAPSEQEPESSEPIIQTISYYEKGDLVFAHISKQDVQPAVVYKPSKDYKTYKIKFIGTKIMKNFQFKDLQDYDEETRKRFLLRIQPYPENKKNKMMHIFSMSQKMHKLAKIKEEKQRFEEISNKHREIEEDILKQRVNELEEEQMEKSNRSKRKKIEDKQEYLLRKAKKEIDSIFDKPNEESIVVADKNIEEMRKNNSFPSDMLNPQYRQRMVAQSNVPTPIFSSQGQNQESYIGGNSNGHNSQIAQNSEILRNSQIDRKSEQQNDAQPQQAGSRKQSEVVLEIQQQKKQRGQNKFAQKQIIIASLNNSKVQSQQKNIKQQVNESKLKENIISVQKQLNQPINLAEQEMEVQQIDIKVHKKQLNQQINTLFSISLSYPMVLNSKKNKDYSVSQISLMTQQYLDQYKKQSVQVTEVLKKLSAMPQQVLVKICQNILNTLNGRATDRQEQTTSVFGRYGQYTDIFLTIIRNRLIDIHQLSESMIIIKAVLFVWYCNQLYSNLQNKEIMCCDYNIVKSIVDYWSANYQRESEIAGVEEKYRRINIQKLAEYKNK